MDRYGPEGAALVRVAPYCLISFGLIPGVLMYEGLGMLIALLAAIVAGIGTGWFAIGLSNAAGDTYKRFMVDGTSTPYVEQYSYQQALVMQGKTDEALESFEAVIAEKPDEFDPRVKAAELYARDKRNFVRAAELFREAQRIPAVTAGQFVYVTNRLTDLYTGPLNEPGKALVELRKLIDKYPGSPAAENARDALATLKQRHVGTDLSS